MNHQSTWSKSFLLENFSPQDSFYFALSTNLNHFNAACKAEALFLMLIVYISSGKTQPLNIHSES